MSSGPEKILIIRFSSFGDIMQCLPAVARLRQHFTQAQMHFVTRADFVDVVKSYRIASNNTNAPRAPIDCIWQLDRATGWQGLLRLMVKLRHERFTHVYDAHSNLRSFFISAFLRIGRPVEFVRRSKQRMKRLLLFRFRTNLFPKPFCGADSYLTPLREWLGDSDLNTKFDSSFDCSSVILPLPQTGRFNLQSSTAIVPGAAWPLKEWPKTYWQNFIRQLGGPVVVLGGANDEICKNLVEPSDQCLNLAGQLTWLQCLKLIGDAKAVVAGDTGLMHAADLLGRPTVALIGPTAFGYPKQPTSFVVEVPLHCRPCTKDGRGACRNKEYKACLTRIEPLRVVTAVQSLKVADNVVS